MRYLFLLTVLLMLGGVSLKAQANGTPSERTTPLEGDLNHDLKVDVADVTYLVNLIMSKRSEDGLTQYADRPAGGYENFLVQVNTRIDNHRSQMIGNLQKDRCIINLPVNYSATGNPVRLVIANFSTSSKITSKTTKAYNTLPHVDALLAEGYAVMQVNGTPGHTDGKSSGSLGTPAFLQCVQAAYEYVTKKYNIRKMVCFLAVGRREH